MLRIIFRVAVIVLVVGVKPVMAQRYGNLPLAFEPNQGQSDSRVKFLSRGFSAVSSGKISAFVTLSSMICRMSSVRSALP